MPAVNDGGFRLRVPLQRTEATGAGLRLTLSFSTVEGTAAVAIGARLSADSASDGVAGGEVWLRIHTPGGTVDRFPMQRGSPVASGTYHAQYWFPTAGLFLVTAEGRAGTDGDVRTVQVTAEVEVGRGAGGAGQNWLLPVGILGTLGMVATRAFLMAGPGL